MKLLPYFTALMKFINPTPEVSRKTNDQMTRSARRAKKQLMRQQQAAKLQNHLKNLSMMDSMKLKERLKKYHDFLEKDLTKNMFSEKYISSLLDFIEELEDPVGAKP